MKKLTLTLLIILSLAGNSWAASCGGVVCPSGTCIAEVDPGGTKDYLSAAVAEADCDGDLTAGSAKQIFNCISSDGTDDTTAVTFSGWTTSSSYDITVDASTDTHNGIWDDDGYVLKTSSEQISLYIQEDYMTVKALQVLNNVNEQYYHRIGVDNVASSNFTLIDKCFIKKISGYQGKGIVFNDADLIGEVRNTIIHGEGIIDSTSYGIWILLSSSVSAKNLTISGFNTGINGVATVQNSAIFNNTTDISGPVTLTYTACDDSDCDSGTGNIGWDDSAATWNANFIDYANGNFGVLNSAADLYNAGTDLSGSGVTDDIRGVARPQFRIYDIGAFEYTVDNSSGWTGDKWGNTNWGTKKNRWQ
jgi:hypothetical protein